MPPITRTGATAMHVPRTQSAATDRRDHDVEVGDLRDQLQRGGTRARDDAFVVEGMDLDRAGALDHFGQHRAPRVEGVVART